MKMQISPQSLTAFCLTIFASLACLAAAEPDRPMMKAIVAHEYGGPEVLKYEDAPRPEPKENELLVRVIACGVNPADPLVISGRLAKEFGTHLPLIPGYDVAGVVEKTGAKVRSLRRAMRFMVMRSLAAGGRSSRCSRKTKPRSNRRPRRSPTRPRCPLAALTAWQSLIDVAKLSAGQTVLIHGGSGGVGVSPSRSRKRGAHA